jgi:hypothetical protein
LTIYEHFVSPLSMKAANLVSAICGKMNHRRKQYCELRGLGEIPARNVGILAARARIKLDALG